MSGFAVDPGALAAAAAQLDGVAAAVARVQVSVRAEGVPATGRADTDALVGSVLDALGSALRGLGTAVAQDAEALRAAAAGYARSDARAVPRS